MRSSHSSHIALDDQDESFASGFRTKTARLDFRAPSDIIPRSFTWET